MNSPDHSTPTIHNPSPSPQLPAEVRHEGYPPDWARVVLMVAPDGEMHAIGGDQPPGEGDKPFIGLDRIKAAHAQHIHRLTMMPPERVNTPGGPLAAPQPFIPECSPVDENAALYKRVEHTRAELREQIKRDLSQTSQPSADVEKVAEEIVDLFDLSPSAACLPHVTESVTAILRRLVSAKDAEIARHQEGTVIDLHGNRHLCSMPLALAVAGFVQELEDTKQKLEHARGELRNSYSGEVIGARLRDYEFEKARAERAEAERDALRPEVRAYIAEVERLTKENTEMKRFFRDDGRINWDALNAVIGQANKRSEETLNENLALNRQLAAAEQQLKAAREDTCKSIRALLSKRSEGEPWTWGFVAAFMQMIDEVEKGGAK